ncbi:MAG TPA: hypothetical protein VFI31_10620 [Pirellulales bacterium]|nr:hypothetical protein [Pirellulales bacterium]
MRTAIAITIWYIAGAYTVAVGIADDETPPSKAGQRAAKRLEIMRGAIDDFQITSSEIEDKSLLKFSERPSLRYADQSREAGAGLKGVIDATLWRLGTTGRPKAIVTLEIYLADQGNPVLTYEFVSLTPQKFDMKRALGVAHWMPHSTDLSMSELKEAPAPANTLKARQSQMRELARRFTAEEKLGSESISLRLLAQPIDRYDDKMAGILDGAVFVFANGTNPEMGLLLECSEKQWSFGTFRLASAALFAQFDGESIDVAAKPKGYPVDAPYTATRHGIFLPDDEEE